MDSHTKPYTCYHPNCKRYTEGFSRRDNLNIHLKSHRGSKGKKPRRMRSPEVDGGVSSGDLRRIERKRQRDMLKLVLKTTKSLLKQVEEEQEGDSTSEDTGDENEDEIAESSRNEGQ
ncbi:hypothetical protein BDD12DRAFT_835516 [Trichophaea hybrida]|nr:hypothetical protein BDD12DRAFT_835516 [Trichophaea hybrida]